MTVRVEHKWIDKEGDQWIAGDDGIAVAVEGRGWVQLSTDRFLGREIATQLAAEREKVRERETVLDAWHSIFGTTQLTHASCRMKSAEDRAEAAERKLNEAYRDIRTLTSHSERTPEVFPPTYIYSIRCDTADALPAVVKAREKKK